MSKSKHKYSSEVLTRAEKTIISELKIGDVEQASSRTNKSPVWKFFGHLYHFPPGNGSDNVEVLLDGDRLYCKLCLEREQDRYSNNATGHISRVKSYGKSSTTTLKEHLQIEHKMKFEEAEHSSSTGSNVTGKRLMQPKLVLRQKLENFEPCSSQFELSRDIAIWGALDLEPFMFTEKAGIKYFVHKNFPKMTLPSRSTLSRGALYDVYDAVTTKVKDQLQGTVGGAICIMMDGWTDKYKRYPYLGLRVSYVDSDWNFRVVTISFKVVEKHTAESISSHVREELSEFGLNLQAVQVFTTHDGAANMVKASQLLRSSHFQHCVAHSLHLLVMTDGINTVPELVDVLHRCKTAVVKLDAKCYMVDSEQLKSEDRQVMDDFLDRIATSKTVLQADEDIDLEMSCENVDADAAGVGDDRLKQHKSLKQSCITRWNSVLEMISSILCLWREFNEALKINGDRDYCLSEDDKVLLTELQTFLTPFRDLTELVSSQQPHLGLIPLIVREIKDTTQLVAGDSEVMVQLKEVVRQRVEYRIKMNEAVTLATLVDPSLKRLISDELSLDEAKSLLCKYTKRAVEFRRLKSSTASGTCSSSGVTTATSTSTVITGEKQTTDSRSAEESQSKSKKMKLVEKFSSPQSRELDDSIATEVNSYLHVTTANADEEPLVFWKRHRAEFPNLSVLAKNYLSISASSVPVEAMFSTTGLILNMKRSSMAPYRANILSVVHDNYPKFFRTSRSSSDM